ncbi:MAG: hypothetical protein MJZ33_13515 [Paludibacteraceae bacterium]|nr:hypothetical protein [Paludibacteraceae bacterium]
METIEQQLIPLVVVVISSIVLYKLITKIKEKRFAINPSIDYSWIGHAPIEDLKNSPICYEGEVKKITRYYTNINKNPIQKEGIRFIANYNKNQKISESFIYDRKGNVEEHLIYQYDTNNNLIREIKVSNDGTSSPSITYHYNEKDQLVETCFYCDGKISSKSTSLYDERGNLIENREKYMVDDSITIDRFAYNEKNKLIEYTSSAEIAETKEVYLLNENDDLVEAQTVDIQTGEVQHKSVQTYNAQGKISETIEYEGDILKDKDIYIYNYENKLTEIRSFDNKNSLVEKVIYLYDSRGSQNGLKEYKKDKLTFCYMDEIEYYS